MYKESCRFWRTLARIIFWVEFHTKDKDSCNSNTIYTVDSRYLEFQGTHWFRDIRTSTYQSWESEENNKLNKHI